MRKITIDDMANLFELVFSVGMDIKLVASKYEISLSHCYRLTRAQIRRKETLPLLAKYRPSWVQKEIEEMMKLIKIKTRDGLTIETSDYGSISDALKGERVADDNVRSVRAESIKNCGGDCGDCQPCAAVKEQAK